MRQFDSMLKPSPNSSWPRISVVLGNYNYGHWVERALLSILEQDYPNLELLVIDDGSTDDSVRVLEKYKKSFQYWNPRDNQGHFSWIKEASDRATGDLFNWLCSDDFFEKDAFRKIGTLYLEKRPQLITGSAIRWAESGEKESELKPLIPESFEELFVRGLGLPQPATFIQTDLFRKALPPPGLVDILVDTATYLRFWMQNDGQISTCAIPEVLAHAQNHKRAQTVSQGLRTKQEIKKIYSFLAAESSGFQKQLLQERLRLHQSLDQIEEIAANPKTQIFSLWKVFKENPQIVRQRCFWGALKRKMIELVYNLRFKKTSQH